MKILCVVFALFVSLSAAAQTVPPKKANTVIITTSDSARVALRKLAVELQERGYAIDKIDYDLNSLSTKGKAIRRSTIVLTINALHNSKGIVLRGQYHIESLGVVIDNQAEFSGPETGGSKASFRELEAIAKTYPEGAISYSVTP